METKETVKRLAGICRSEHCHVKGGNNEKSGPLEEYRKDCMGTKSGKKGEDYPLIGICGLQLRFLYSHTFSRIAYCHQKGVAAPMGSPWRPAQVIGAENPIVRSLPVHVLIALIDIRDKGNRTSHQQLSNRSRSARRFVVRDGGGHAEKPIPSLMGDLFSSRIAAVELCRKREGCAKLEPLFAGF